MARVLCIEYELAACLNNKEERLSEAVFHQNKDSSKTEKMQPPTAEFTAYCLKKKQDLIICRETLTYARSIRIDRLRIRVSVLHENGKRHRSGGIQTILQ